jgi:hypothetical protein
MICRLRGDAGRVVVELLLDAGFAIYMILSRSCEVL